MNEQETLIARCRAAVEADPEDAQRRLPAWHGVVADGTARGGAAAVSNARRRSIRATSMRATISAMHCWRSGARPKRSSIFAPPLRCGRTAPRSTIISVTRCCLTIGRRRRRRAFVRRSHCDPQHAGAHNNLGNALRTQGRYAEAIEEYKAALAHTARVLRHAEQYWFGAARPAPAGRGDRLFRAGVERRPDYAEASNNIGGALLALDRPEEALALVSPRVCRRSREPAGAVWRGDGAARHGQLPRGLGRV